MDVYLQFWGQGCIDGQHQHVPTGPFRLIPHLLMQHLHCLKCSKKCVT